MASGIGSSLGYAAESVVGTPVTPTHWAEYNSESLALAKSVLQGSGLRGSGLYPRSSRRVVTGRNAGGSIELDLATNKMGPLFRQMLGSSTSALVSGSAYQQVHIPGSLTGKSLTIQKLVPSDAGTSTFTYDGCKITDWSIDCEVGAIATLSLTIDAHDEVDNFAAGTPSYAASTGVFHFGQGSVILGGTVSTSSGVTSVSGGTTVGSVRAVTVTGTNPMTTGDDNQRFGGTKREQEQNDWRSLTGSLEVDFVNETQVYDLHSADTATALVLSFVGTTAISGSNYPTLELIVPSIRFDTGTPQVDGPDLITLDADWTGLDNGTDPVCQIRYVTSDTAI